LDAGSVGAAGFDEQAASNRERTSGKRKSVFFISA